MLTYEKPSEEQWLTPQNFYVPTLHFAERYKKRMGENATKATLKKILAATEEELGLRANYMLLFSIHGRKGETPHTEVRYYFDWEIVIDNKNKSLITMYQVPYKKNILIAEFGDPKLRKSIYQLWFKKKYMVNQESSEKNDC